MISSNISPPRSDLLHSVWQSLGPSTLLPMASFHSFQFLWIYVPHLPYPFPCWWAFRWLPCLGHCKQCCSEHWGAYVLLDHVFLWIYAQEWSIHWRFLRFPSHLGYHEYWGAFPVLYSKFSLVIYFIHSSVYMSVSISQTIPPSTPHLVTMSLFSTSVI